MSDDWRQAGELRPYEVVQAMPLLEALGIEFHLDLDDQLELELPPLDAAALTIILLFDAREAIEQELRRRREELLHQFCGGPLNGKSTRGLVSPFRCFLETLADGTEVVRGHHVHHVARARWAAYAVQSDGRAIYVGEATTAKKARQLVFDRFEKRRSDQ